MASDDERFRVDADGEGWVVDDKRLIPKDTQRKLLAALVMVLLMGLPFVVAKAQQLIDHLRVQRPADQR